MPLNPMKSGQEIDNLRYDGCTPHFDADGDNTAQAVKTSAGRLFGLEVQNPNAADAWLQLFDALIANVTVGTTTPNQSYLVPAGYSGLYGAFDRDFDPPMKFSTAISYSCTTTPTGNGDPTTGLIVNAWYI